MTTVVRFRVDQMPNFESGYEIIEGFLTKSQLHPVEQELQSAAFPAKAGGIRNAEKKFLSVLMLANSSHLLENAKNYLDDTPNLVRAIIFNKTHENNWLVAWHQDKTIAVSKRFEHPAWGPWSLKDGIHHVQPPTSALNQMITFRIHLDSASRENGCLKILPNSHTLGILSQTEIQQYAAMHSPVYCEVKAGAALVMRPHILHASSKATAPSQRRVLHLEYSSLELPAGISWA